MGGSADTDEKKKAKSDEFADRLVALNALKKKLTPEVLQKAFNKFHHTVQDQQRIPELATTYEITDSEARVIMNQATISSQADGDNDNVGPAQIWDRAVRLAGIYGDKIRHIDLRDQADIEAICKAVEAGEEPVMVNDRANILASTMLQATNSAKIP